MVWAPWWCQTILAINKAVYHCNWSVPPAFLMSLTHQERVRLIRNAGGTDQVGRTDRPAVLNAGGTDQLQ